MKRTEPRAYPAQDSVFISIYFLFHCRLLSRGCLQLLCGRFSGEIVAEERF